MPPSEALEEGSGDRITLFHSPPRRRAVKATRQPRSRTPSSRRDREIPSYRGRQARGDACDDGSEGCRGAASFNARSTQLPALLTPVMRPGSPREAPRWRHLHGAPQPLAGHRGRPEHPPRSRRHHDVPAARRRRNADSRRHARRTVDATESALAGGLGSDRGGARRGRSEAPTETHEIPMPARIARVQLCRETPQDQRPHTEAASGGPAMASGHSVRSRRCPARVSTTHCKGRTNALTCVGLTFSVCR